MTFAVDWALKANDLYICLAQLKIVDVEHFDRNRNMEYRTPPWCHSKDTYVMSSINGYSPSVSCGVVLLIYMYAILSN